MRKHFIFILFIILLVSQPSAAEIGGDLTVSFYRDFNRTSTGIGGVIFPQPLTYGKLSFGIDLGVEFLERFVYDVFPQQLYTNNTTEIWWDSVFVDTKEYNDFLFIPLGIILRFDIGNPENLSRICPSVSIASGGILTLRQISYREVRQYSDDDLSGFVLYPPFEYSGDSETKFDLYIKPRVALTWHRIYLSYEHYFNTKYMLGSVSVGYVFSL